MNLLFDTLSRVGYLYLIKLSELMIFVWVSLPVQIL